MSKQKITIEVDLPEGYEATGEFRPAKPGELFLTHTGLPRAIFNDLADWRTIPRIILRQKYVWPEWLKGWGFVKAWPDANEIYLVTKNSSVRHDTSWEFGCQIVNDGTCKVLGIPVPDIQDWTQPVLNPNYSP